MMPLTSAYKMPLHESHYDSAHSYTLRDPSSLEVLIVGAGLGGLAAAIALARTAHSHRITIIEQASALSEVGAGIQVPPNCSKILIDWGMKEAFEAASVQPRAFILRSYKDGKVLSGYYGITGEEGYAGSEGEYGGPYWHIHRADFHRILVDKARELGVQTCAVKLSSSLVNVTFPPANTRPTAHLANGTTISADLIIGADGLKSRCREILLGRPDPAYNTGDLAYRILVRKEAMEEYERERKEKGLDSPSLEELLKEPAINFWLGPNSHAVCYVLKACALYNIVLLCPDNLPPETNVAPAEPDEIRVLFKNWDTRLQKILDIAVKEQEAYARADGTSQSNDPARLCTLVNSKTTKFQKWRLQNSRELPTWTHPSGGFTLLGDACHATLPYLAQGAAMAIEDAQVLGLLIAKMTRKSQLPDILDMYEQLRKPRTTKVVLASTDQQRVSHMADGPMQQERDRVMREYEARAPGGKAVDPRTGKIVYTRQDGGRGFYNKWADWEFRNFLFAYDGEKEIEKAWERYLLANAAHSNRHAVGARAMSSARI
ncbi:hypothetical protein BDZ91DRAFT_550157 [Kalaharituber pfeilii]|nr:hypothetical protein BDZ91DRAFT_550157 [Kalaharituber pfeilii]